MATMVHPRLEGTTTSMDKAELFSLIEEEARLVGLSAARVIERVTSGRAGGGYIWDDLSLLVSLLAE